MDYRRDINNLAKEMESETNNKTQSGTKRVQYSVSDKSGGSCAKILEAAETPKYPRLHSGKP